jgi:type IV secretion system protein VirB11
MRPDRIILGELRGPEAFAFLRATNTGHPGSMTTIHADSPTSAVEQLVMLVLRAVRSSAGTIVQHYVGQSVDILVQLSRIGGRRRVEAVVLSERLGGSSEAKRL